MAFTSDTPSDPRPPAGDAPGEAALPELGPAPGAAQPAHKPTALRRLRAVVLGSLAGLLVGYIPAALLTWWSGVPVAVLLVGLTVGVGVAKAGGRSLPACLCASAVAYVGATLAEYTAYCANLAHLAGPTLQLLSPEYYELWLSKSVAGIGGVLYIGASFLAYLVVRSTARRP